MSETAICMSHNLSQILFYYRHQFFKVMTNHLSNKSSRDSKTQISRKCCRTYFCNANKCVMSDPMAEDLTPDFIFRQNYKLWIKGKHLTCDVMKKYIRTKKNDFQPALKKMFEWLLWELEHRPCSCAKCDSLRTFLEQDKQPKTQLRCPNCLCGLACHQGLKTSCHDADGKCKGKRFCSFCFRFKPICSFQKMMNHLKLEQMTGEYDLIKHVFLSSSFICNMCFVSNKNKKFVDMLSSRDMLQKSLRSEDTKIRFTKRRSKADVLPEDILLQDLNWHIPRELSFLQTREHMKSLLLSFQTQLCQLNREKKEAIEKFKGKLERVKEGNYDDKRFIEQMVMLVERKKREKVQVNMRKGTVYILQ